MKKIYQTIHKEGNQRGNCMQAVIASLFDLELKDVPNFITKPHPLDVLKTFVESKGYIFEGMLENPEHLLMQYKDYYDCSNVIPQDLFDKIKYYDGIDGLFYAAVYSPNHYKPDEEHAQTHAVIIDKEFNIVHDPNEDYKNIESYPRAEALGYNGIIKIYLIN